MDKNEKIFETPKKLDDVKPFDLSQNPDELLQYLPDQEGSPQSDS